MIRPAAALLALACAALAAAAEPVPGASVESLLAVARQQNPDYAAMRLEAEAAAARVTAAGALPDPTLRVELENITNAGSEAQPNLLPARVGDTKYTFIQPLPFWGKRELKQAAAAADASQAQSRASAGWNDLAGRIKTTYAQAYLAARNEALTREVLDLVGDLERLAQARYASGLVPQQDVIRAQSERANLHAELVNIEMERHHLHTRLNALLARPGNAALAAPERLRPLPASLDAQALAARLPAVNAQFAVEAARVAAAEKTRDLAYRNRYPDFALGVSPMQTRNRVAQWGVMLELNIPLQQASRRAQEQEAESLLAAAQARREAALNQARADLEESLSALDAARRVEQLTASSLLPQAELVYQAALSGYENGKLDFATLLDAQRQIRKLRLDRLKAQVEAQMRLADIERLLGEAS